MGSLKNYQDARPQSGKPLTVAALSRGYAGLAKEVGVNCTRRTHAVRLATRETQIFGGTHVNTHHAKRVYLEQVKRLVPLTLVLARYGIELRKQGRQLCGPCPIHGGRNKRQFSVNPATSEWHCFGDCARGGAMLEFVAAKEGIDIFGAAKLVGDWFAVHADNQHTQQQQRRRTMSEGTKPTHKVYSAQKRDGEKDFLTRIGSGWGFSTKDGRAGLSIQLSALPLGERMVIFEGDDEEAEDKSKRKK